MAPKDEERPYKKRRLFRYIVLPPSLGFFMFATSLMPYMLTITALSSSLDATIVLLVGSGDEKTSLVVHKSVLCAASPFFESACKPEWMKPEDKIIEMPEDDPEAAKIMVYWMYHNEICVSPEVLKRPIGPTCKVAMRSPWGLFAKIYVLGQKYQISLLRNDAIDAIICHWIEADFALGIVPWVYQNTSGSSDLRKLLIRIVRRETKFNELDQLKNELCAEFCLDLYERFIDVRGPNHSIKTQLESPTKDFCISFHAHLAGGHKCMDYKTYVTTEDKD